MSQANVEIVRHGNDAFNRGDLDAQIANLHPDVEWEEGSDAVPGLGGTYHGPAGVRKYLEELLEPWESFQVEVEELSEGTDGRVFFEFLLRARGRASGADTELRGWQVFWLAEGKITKRQRLWTRDEALEASGLRGWQK